MQKKVPLIITLMAHGPWLSSVFPQVFIYFLKCFNTPSIIKQTGKMIQTDTKNALRVMKFDTEIAKTQYFDVEKRCRGLSCMQRVMEGRLPKARCPFIANFYGKNVSKGKMYTFQHFKKMGCKKTCHIHYVFFRL